MSGNPHTPEIEREKRQALARFQKEMDAYGLRVTPKVAVMASKEVCKALRGFTHPAQVAEEIADATIMLEQLRYIFNVGPAVDQMVDRKIARLVQRIHDAKE